MGNSILTLIPERYSDQIQSLLTTSEKLKGSTRTLTLPIKRSEIKRFKLVRPKLLIYEKKDFKEKTKGSPEWTKISNFKKIELSLEEMSITKQRKTRVDQPSILLASTMTKLMLVKSLKILIMEPWLELYVEVKFSIKKITGNITFLQVFRDH